MKVALVILIILSMQGSMSCQRSLIETEKYYLSDLLNSAAEYKIQELTETDSNNVVLRQWTFDSSGKLQVENDFRGMTVISSIGGIENNVSNTFKITHSYSYDSSGKKLSVKKIDYAQKDTTILNSFFHYIGTDTIVEALSLSKTIVYGDIESEFDISSEICTVKVKDKIDRTASKWTYNGIPSSQEKVKYFYNDYGKLVKMISTYVLGKDTTKIDDEKNVEHLSNIITFQYDSNNSLERVIRKDNEKVIYDNSLFYNTETTKLIRIESRHDESRDPQELTIELFYDENGLLERVNSNDIIFNYKIKTNKR